MAFQGAALPVIPQNSASGPLKVPGTCGMDYVSNHNTARASSNKELVRETTQIRKPTWAQQDWPSTSPTRCQHFSPLAWYCYLSIPLTDRIFHKATSVSGEHVLGLFIIVLFPSINFVICHCCFCYWEIFSPSNPFSRKISRLQYLWTSNWLITCVTTTPTGFKGDIYTCSHFTLTPAAVLIFRYVMWKIRKTLFHEVSHDLSVEVLG